MLGSSIPVVCERKNPSHPIITWCLEATNCSNGAQLGENTVGEHRRNSKFSYVSPRSIYGETNNEGKESASTYPCRLLSGSTQVNGVDGVVLVVIQITDDPSAEQTAPPCSTHVQPGDVSHALIQQGERERLRKTPSSNSTTAWWWWRSVANL